jgi:hypothetical protein
LSIDVMAPWYRGNIALEDGILAEFDRKPAPAKFRAAAKEYEVSLAGLGKLASRLEEQVKTEASAPKVPAFEQALSKVLAEAGTFERLDLHRARYANAGGSDKQPRSKQLTSLHDILVAQLEDVNALRPKLKQVIDGLRSATALADKSQFVPVMLSGRNAFADTMPQYSDLLSAFQRFSVRSCMTTIDATMQIYPQGVEWLKGAPPR